MKIAKHFIAVEKVRRGSSLNADKRTSSDEHFVCLKMGRTDFWWFIYYGS
jgi:hypothetical protein